jgi:hypothetical protein
MLPFASPLLARQGQAARMVNTGHNPTTTLTAFGVQVGDLMIVGQSANRRQGDPPTSAGGAWQFVVEGSQGGAIYYRFATAADLGAKVSGSGDFYLVAYRGARSVSQRIATSSDQAGSFSIAGVKKSPRHAGFVLMLANAQGYAAQPTAPATWAQRFLETQQANVGLWDRLYPANPIYVDQTAFTVTRQNAGSATQLVLLELIA